MMPGRPTRSRPLQGPLRLWVAACLALAQCTPAAQPVATPAPTPPAPKPPAASAEGAKDPAADSGEGQATTRRREAPPKPLQKVQARSTVTGAIVIAPVKDDNTAWIQWQGWSSNARKLGWRQGPATEMNRIGDPLDIARLGTTEVEDRLHVVDNVGEAIRGRSIGIRNPARTERKGPEDVLVEVTDGVVAIIARPDRGALGVLCRSASGYRPVMTLPLRGAEGVVQVQAEHAADDSWTAIVVHVGEGNRRRAWLLGIAAGVAAVSSDGSCGALAVDALDADAESSE